MCGKWDESANTDERTVGAEEIIYRQCWNTQERSQGRPFHLALQLQGAGTVASVKPDPRLSD